MAWTLFPLRVTIVVACAAVALAALGVLLLRPDRAQNRRLALALGIEASFYALGEGLMYMTSDPASAWAMQYLTYVLMAAFPFVMLRFYATLETRLAKPLRARGVPTTLAVLAVVAALAAVLARDLVLLPGVLAGRPDGQIVWYARNGPASPWIFGAYMLTLLLGIVLAIAVFVEARGANARSKARAYLAAFTLRDGSTAWLVGAYALGLWSVPRGAMYFTAGAYFVFALLVAYAVIRMQLFDVDLKIKWTLRRGTLAGVFVAGFVVASAVAEQYLQRFGVVAGGIAVGLLLLAFRPIERAADRIADAAMPSVHPTPDYVAFRRMEVYKSALEGALQDGQVSDRERDVLRRLRASLGIADADADALERDLAQSGPT